MGPIQLSYFQLPTSPYVFILLLDGGRREVEEIDVLHIIFI